MAYGLANCYYNSNLINEAYKMYLRCIEIDPQCANAYQGIALIRFYKYEQMEEAREYALKALERNNKDINSQIIVAYTEKEFTKRI
jgi:tetratricopeptide (TPR) repeat protein